MPRHYQPANKAQRQMIDHAQLMKPCRCCGMATPHVLAHAKSKHPEEYEDYMQSRLHDWNVSVVYEGIS